MPIEIGGGGGGGSGTDADAIHDNVAGEINAIAEKTTPVAADEILIEDSAAANAKKKVQASNWPLRDVSCCAYNNANISVNDATYTILDLNSEYYDTDTMHDGGGANPSRITVPVNGKYLCVASLVFAANATGVRKCTIMVNNANVGSVTIPAAGGGFTSEVQAISLLELSATDYVEVRAYQNSGGALNVTYGANNSPMLSVQLVGEV